MRQPSVNHSRFDLREATPRRRQAPRRPGRPIKAAPDSRPGSRCGPVGGSAPDGVLAPSLNRRPTAVPGSAARAYRFIAIVSRPPAPGASSTRNDGERHRASDPRSRPLTNMLAVATPLHDDGPRLGLIEVDQDERGRVVLERLDERGDVFGQAGPASDRVEVADPGVEDLALVLRRQPAQHQVDQVGRRSPGCRPSGRRPAGCRAWSCLGAWPRPCAGWWRNRCAGPSRG